MDENKETYVLDASFVLAVLLKDKPKIIEYFNHLNTEKANFVSISFLKYEVGNGLRSAFFAKRITIELAKVLYQDFFNLQISEVDVDYFETFSLALRKNLNFYDSSYLLLSKNLKAKLLTFDEALRKKI